MGNNDFKNTDATDWVRYLDKYEGLVVLLRLIVDINDQAGYLESTDLY